MKKTIPLLLALLLLVGCSVQPSALEPAQTETILPTEVAPEPAVVMTFEPKPTPEQTLPIVDRPKLSDVEFTFDGTASYLRLTLPEGWTCVPEEDSAERRSWILYASTDDGFRIEVSWWESFGLCGTGVSFSEIDLPGGRKATLATENGDGMVWWTLILSESPDWFTMQICAPQDTIDAHQAEIDLLIENLQLGALSQPMVVDQPQADR